MSKSKLTRTHRILVSILAVAVVAAVPVLMYQFLDPSAGRFLLALVIGGVTGYLGVTLGWLWDEHVKERERLRGE